MLLGKFYSILPSKSLLCRLRQTYFKFRDYSTCLIFLACRFIRYSVVLFTLFCRGVSDSTVLQVIANKDKGTLFNN